EPRPRNKTRNKSGEESPHSTPNSNKGACPVMSDSVAPGVIAGYTVIEEIGAGGMGRTLLAERNGVKVVLKESLDPDPDEREHLAREARFLASLRHPHLPVVHAYEAGVMVMEHIQGVAFKKHIEEIKKQPGWNRSEPYLRKVLGWALQMLDTLDYLH